MAGGIMYVDGIRVPFENESNVLTVIRKTGIVMPTFCYHSELSTFGACRMCLVETEDGRIEASCSMKPRDGLRIRTSTARLLRYRRMNLELMLASHCRDCTICEMNGKCRLQMLAKRFGVRNIRFSDTRPHIMKDESSPAIIRDPRKCILCGDCVRTCDEMQGMGILNFAFRGSRTQVTPAFGEDIADTHCVSCGQCAAVCPTGAITVKNEIGAAWAALNDPTKRVVVQIAPAVRVAIGEAFQIEPGVNCLNRLVSALKIMGADAVYDTAFGADLTVKEESQEFLDRLEKNGPFPMFTSCCPAWVKYLEYENPKYLTNISTCKSPMEMLGSMLVAEDKRRPDPDGRTLYQIAVMPCSAKKMEAGRGEFSRGGKPDVDLVITTNGIITMIQESGICFQELQGESPDMPFGVGSGAGTIFGTTGGVAEAVFRTAAQFKDRTSLSDLAYSGIRGEEYLREITLDFGDRTLKAAVVHGLVNAKALLKKMDAGEVYYDLVEVMSCKYGCVGGAGQPLGNNVVKKERSVGLYEADNCALIKCSDDNPALAALYIQYSPEEIHELLHVRYQS